jgi:tetraacyldisaccharide 4'-kinase
MTLRASLYRTGALCPRRLSCPVVSVGNLAVGGTGKTPMILYLARRFRESGLRPVVLSRGYRGRAERSGGIVTDGNRILLSAEAAGDEPWMIADLLSGVPVLVGKDRHAAGQEALRRFSPDVILLDDGYQHLRLARDLNLLLLDAAAPVGNGRIFPRGPLREPLSAAARADAIVLTRCAVPEGTVPMILSKYRALLGKPVFRAAHIPKLRLIASPDAGAGRTAGSIAGKRIFAFSGIARNEEFHASIHWLGGVPVAFSRYADHYRYASKDTNELQQAARRARADLMAATEKDWARLGGKNPFEQPLAVIGVDMDVVSGKEAMDGLLHGLFQNRIIQVTER